MVGEWAVIQLGLGVKGSRQTDNGAQRRDVGGWASATQEKENKRDEGESKNTFLSSFPLVSSYL